MDLKPLHDRIIVRRIPEPDTTPGGIVLPETTKEKPTRGEVVAVGEGYRTDNGFTPLTVTVGDEVLFGKYTGTDVTYQGEEYVIFREEEVLAIVSNVPVGAN